MTAPASSDRWGQLTFSSFDDGVNPGGWQVKQATGALSDEEQTYLRSQIITQFDLVRPLPNFPTPDDVAALPRRLVYTSDDRQRGGYWHTCFAGADASGRPGNVFAHTVLDRDIRILEPVFRPVELWRSPHWLAPYGADAVRHAKLAVGGRPELGGAVRRHTVIDFILDPTEWRLGVLSALVDGVIAALENTARVALAVDSPDEAAMWIGAVSHCLTPETARCMGFSTFERGADLESVWAREIHLAAIPRIDLPSVVREDGLIVIDAREPVTLGELGASPHLTAGGFRIPVTALSLLAESVFQDHETAAQVLARADAIATEVGEGPMDVAWPMAAAMAEHGDRFADVREHLDTVLTARPPAGLNRAPTVARIVEDRLFARIGHSAQAAWRATIGAQGAMLKLAIESYLRLAMRDRDWLAAPGGAPLPPQDQLDADLDARLITAFEAAVAATAGDYGPSPERCVDILRLLDFGVRAGLAGRPAGSALPESIRAAIRTHVAPVLLSPDGVKVVEAVKLPEARSLSEAIRAEIDKLLLTTTAPAPLLAALNVVVHVVAWLYPKGVRTATVDTFTRYRSTGREISISVSAYVVLATRHALRDGSDERTRAAAALWLLLDAEQRIGNRELDKMVGLLPSYELDPADVFGLLRSFGTAVPPLVVLRALLAEWTDGVARLAESVSRIEDIPGGRWTDDPDAADARDVADLRLSSHRHGNTASTKRNNLAMLRSVNTLISLEPAMAVVAECEPPFVSAVTIIALDDIQQELGTGGPARTDISTAWVSGTAFERRATASSFSDTYGRALRRPTPFTISEGDWQRAVRFTPRVPPLTVLDAVRACLSSGTITVVTLVAVVVAGAPDFPFIRWAIARDPQRLVSLRTADESSMFDGVVAALAARGLMELEPGDLEWVADRIGLAEYGARWSARDKDNDTLIKFARKRWKDLSTRDDPKGLLRKWR